MRDKRYDIRDGGKTGVRGLILRTYSSGTRGFYFQAKRGSTWHRIGLAPQYNLTMAREAAKQIVQTGVAPIEVEQSDLTVNAFVTEVYGPASATDHTQKRIRTESAAQTGIARRDRRG